MEGSKELQIAEIKVDDEGYVKCPECGVRKKCGTAGVENILKNHQGTKICKETKAKRDREAKQKKDGSLYAFMRPRPKPVPSTVTADPVAQGLASGLKGQSSAQTNHPNPRDQQKLHPNSAFTCKLQWIAKNLPNTTPVATPNDIFARFANPSVCDDPSLASDNLWEDVLNPFLKEVLGWGKSADLEKDIRRGRLGFEAVVGFVGYFVQERGVEEVLFEGKLTHLVECATRIITAASAPEGIDTSSKITDTEADVPSDDEIIEIMSPAAQKPQVKAPLNPVLRNGFCEGHTVKLSNGQSPHGSYPFALHDRFSLPWNYAVLNGVLILFSRGCRRLQGSVTRTCQPCQDLRNNKFLEGIVMRIEYGIAENTPFAFHGINGLIELLNRKNEHIEFHRLRGLNQARNLLRKATVLDDYKRFLVAIASGKVQRVDALIRVALGQNKGIVAILNLFESAAIGLYHPKSFTEKEEMKSLLLWRMGGNRLATFGNKALGLLSLPTVRTRSIVPPIIPSHALPTIIEIEANINASFESVLDVVQGQGQILHAVLMFDEIAAEKRIRLDRNQRYFLGVCREHGHKKVSLEFVNGEDLEELFQALDDGDVHFAAEATVGAIGILCDNNRIYPARAVMISGDCKKETSEEHKAILQTAIDAVRNKGDLINVRVVNLSSDGEKRRGSAMAQLTFNTTLDPQSDIYTLLFPLVFMDMHVGANDLTADKDWKHVFKRIRNLILRERGILINKSHFTASIVRLQLISEGATQEHIRASFNPKDLQDVRVAFNLLKDIWSLPRIPSATNPSPGFSKAREALWIFGKILFHVIFPYLCVDLSLSEQLEHLSAASHLGLLLYHGGGKDFLPTELYVDIMIMIKNVYFTVAKAKADGLDSFWLILLGTDRLEELFGILRTMIGNDVNLDIFQLAERLSGTTEVSNILAKYPEWDRAPRRINLPALTRTGTGEISSKSDHLKPSSWKGDVKVKNVSLQTSWRRGRRLIEDEFPEYKEIFRKMEDERNVTILSPSGRLLVNIPLPDDDVDESLEEVFRPLNPRTLEENGETRVAVEDGLAAELDRNESSQQTGGLSNQLIRYQGVEMTKFEALKRRSKYQNSPRSMDRLKRVQGDDRHSGAAPVTYGLESLLRAGAQAISEVNLMTTDPIASLLRCDGKAWLCVGEIMSMRNDGKPTDILDIDLLTESTISVTYQLLGLRPTNSDEDPTLKLDWRTYDIKEKVFTVPGRLIQPMNAETSKPRSLTHPIFYLLDSQFLVALSASIFEALGTSDIKSIPKIGLRDEYPYREHLGKACFLCESNSQPAHIEAFDPENPNSVICPLCTSPSISLDLEHGQRVLEHIGAHVLFDRSVNRTEEPCGLCLRPAAICHYYLKKGKGARGSLKIDQEKTRSCPTKPKLSYGVASMSTKSSPCSNIPIICPLCSKLDPAVWRYNIKYHFIRAHPNADLKKYTNLWDLENFEILEMKKKWADRHRVMAKRGKKSKAAPLVISDAHRSQIPLAVGKGKEREKSFDHDAKESDEEERESEEDFELEEDDSDLESGSDSDELVGHAETSDLPVDAGSEVCSPSKTVSQGEKNGDDGVEDAQNAPREDVIYPICSELHPQNNFQDATLSVVLPVESEGSNLPQISPEQQAPIETNSKTPCVNRDVLLSEAGPSTSLRTDGGELLGRGERRKRKIVDIGGLDDCLCGSKAVSTADEVIQCRRSGCETVWYHLSCVNLNQVPKNWLCDACSTSGGGRGGKALRR